MKKYILKNGVQSRGIPAGTVCSKVAICGDGEFAKIKICGLDYTVLVDELEVVEDGAEAGELGETVGNNGGGGESSTGENSGGDSVDSGGACPTCGSVRIEDTVAQAGDSSDDS